MVNNFGYIAHISSICKNVYIVRIRWCSDYVVALKIHVSVQINSSGLETKTRELENSNLYLLYQETYSRQMSYSVITSSSFNIRLMIQIYIMAFDIKSFSSTSVYLINHWVARITYWSVKHLSSFQLSNNTVHENRLNQK